MLAMLAATPKQLSTDIRLFCFFFQFFLFFLFFLFFFFFVFLLNLFFFFCFFFNFFLFSTFSVMYHPLLNSHGKSERSENRKLFVFFLFFVASCQLTQKE